MKKLFVELLINQDTIYNDLVNEIESQETSLFKLKNDLYLYRLLFNVCYSFNILLILLYFLFKEEYLITLLSLNIGFNMFFLIEVVDCKKSIKKVKNNLKNLLITLDNKDLGLNKLKIESLQYRINKILYSKY